MAASKELSQSLSEGFADSMDISKGPGMPSAHDKISELPTQQCDEHHRKIIDQYCQDHDRVACEICVKEYHRNCVHYMKSIPTIAKGTREGTCSQAIKTSTADLASQLKKMKSDKEGRLQQLDQAKAKAHLEVQDLRTRLHNLADAENAQIEFVFEKKKEEVQQDIAAIDNQIDAAETFSKKLNDCRGDNESELFVYIKQGEKVESDTKQKLQALSQSDMALPAYEINSTMEKSLKDVKSLGQFRNTKAYKAILSTQINVKDSGDIDELECNITGVCILPDASLVLADFTNRCLKLVDPSYKLAGCLATADKPFDVCYTDKNEVAVTISTAKRIQFVSVGLTMMNMHSFSVRRFCRGIAFKNGELFVCCGDIGNPSEASVDVYSMSGTFLREIKFDKPGHPMFSIPRYITISSCGSKLHVTNGTAVITTDTTGLSCINVFIGLTRGLS